jgi:hypothetical protein
MATPPFQSLIKKEQEMNQPIMRSLTTAILLSHAALASASDNSATVLPAEGNKQCSDYSANSTIIQMASSKLSATGTLSGAENPNDADTTGESASYSLSGGTVAGFSAATTPIDYAILKSGSDVSVLLYPSGGVMGDGDMRLTVNGVDKVISSISLCYGLGNEVAPPPPPPPLQTLKSCDIDAILDATGVTCPASGERTLVCNYELDKSFFGLDDGSDTCCVCNSAALVECDPNQPAGGPNACLNEGASKTTAAEVPVDIQLNNDPYYRSCVGGTCTYYKY